ncbi:MAG TPA: hypothetical protein VF377_07110, partial [Acidimicrobiia bacterium]
ANSDETEDPSDDSDGGSTGGGPGSSGNGNPGGASGDSGSGNGGSGNGGSASSSDANDTTGGNQKSDPDPADGGDTTPDPSTGDVDPGDGDGAVDDPAGPGHGQDGGNADDDSTDPTDGSKSGQGSAAGSGGSGDGTDVDDESAGFPGLSSSGTDGNFYWWDRHGSRGQWTAHFTYTNSTDRHQYLDIQVTRTYADGSTENHVVYSHFVPAKGSSKMTVWSNDYEVGGANQPRKQSVVKVETTVLKVTTSDKNWQPFSTLTGGPTMVVDVPPHP